MKSIEADDVAVLLAYADKVIIAPGYGMAVAQAQQKVKELADLLESKDIQVKFAIHPVAGRMPGHMNVLLAEAGVFYDHLFDRDEINPEFPAPMLSLSSGQMTPSTRHRTGREARSSACQSSMSTRQRTSSSSNGARARVLPESKTTCSTGTTPGCSTAMRRRRLGNLCRRLRSCKVSSTFLGNIFF